MSEQHGLDGGTPIMTPSKPPRRLAQIPSFRVSTGHFPPPDGVGVGVDGGVGVGVCGGGGQGFGLGGGLGFGQVLQPLTRVKKTRFRERKRARNAVFLEPIFSQKNLVGKKVNILKER
jgi:hypothetical protein